MPSRSTLRRAARVAVIGAIVAGALVASPSAGTTGSEGRQETVQAVEMGGCTATFTSWATGVPSTPLSTTAAGVVLGVSCATPTAAIATAVQIVPLGDVPWGYVPADADACTSCTEVGSSAIHASFFVVGCQVGIGTAVMAPNDEPVRFFTRLFC